MVFTILCVKEGIPSRLEGFNAKAQMPNEAQNPNDKGNGSAV